MTKLSNDSDLACDVVIIGGGIIGLPLGLALDKAGVSVIVVDKQSPAESVQPAFDGRASAFAYTSVQLLKALDVWPHLVACAQPIQDILVSDGRAADRFRRGGSAPHILHFDPDDLAQAGDIEPLGYMIENRDYRVALQTVTGAAPNLKVLAPMTIAAIDYDGPRVRVLLSDKRHIDAHLCIAADGKNSSTRAAAGIKTLNWTYNQHGLVSTVEHDRPHHGIAQEYFLPSGPFAILPLMGNRSSLVWTERSDLAASYLALDQAAFAQQIRNRFGCYLGDVRPVGPRFSYPLGLRLAYDYIKPRLALVGDAAHAVHPIAGQGLNLGLKDVAALAEVLVDAKRLGLDMGAMNVLERYQRWRRFDNVTLAFATDGLNRLFANDHTPVRVVRDLGLGIVNRLKPLRRFFMEHAMGTLGDLPRLLKGQPL
ncbi:MAG: FAD-dependent oxidoreductase [Alphaproteobacteria bacterium]|nr:MAG: FAD-dependent oxidoreductase [Alphaproteobacteria bacterium]